MWACLHNAFSNMVHQTNKQRTHHPRKRKRCHVAPLGRTKNIVTLPTSWTMPLSSSHQCCNGHSSRQNHDAERTDATHADCRTKTSNVHRSLLNALLQCLSVRIENLQRTCLCPNRLAGSKCAISEWRRSWGLANRWRNCIRSWSKISTFQRHPSNRQLSQLNSRYGPVDKMKLLWLLGQLLPPSPLVQQ